MFSDCSYQSQSCQTTAHQTLYIFSDGIYEIPKAKSQLLGLEGFSHLLQKLHQKGVPSIETILDQVQRNCGHQRFTDDLALMQIIFP